MSAGSKPLIVGEAPNATGDPTVPLDGRTGKILADACGLSRGQFRQRFALVNVLTEWPGRRDGARGSSFDLSEARESAARMSRRMRRDRIVVLLGKRVATAFCVKPEYFVEQRLVSARAFVVPHPSGVNKWFNAPENRDAFSVFFRSIAP